MGIMNTVTNILQSVLFPTYSKLSDMIGRAEMFTCSIALYAVSYIIMATAQNYETLVVTFSLFLSVFIYFTYLLSKCFYFTTIFFKMLISHKHL